MTQTPEVITSLSMPELFRRFVETAKLAPTVFTSSGKIPERTPERRRLVQQMQALGAEIRVRKPLAEIRGLLEDENPDVRGWAAGQFLSVDPEWAQAAFSGLNSNITTGEALELTRRARRAPPKRPSLKEMSDGALLERFEDAATREYATRFIDYVGDPRDMAILNRIRGEVTDVMRELKSRNALSLLIPLLDNANITVRHEAAIACLAVAPDRASAVLEAVVATGNLVEAADAKKSLDRWRSGKGLVHGVV